ncbi:MULTISPECIES: AraC family transcriptional regulator [Asticcacaulis]|uniref:helix-turn-helix domain-containing protein n=1 Tax=Asticcacaulis TaxID=76890 RepID=UPI001AE97189|nr:MULTISPECIES: AraC family transcriptional regulator [Asticcacaulis]MBP2161570.1 AraC-like DNA-binding protein [Asticcacaulis solisilvae]MDR6802579.1 AraC-like DNA-binding protein [Asticcacaulis sp. BE141]
MLAVLAPATAACQLMMALIIWRRTQLPGRSDLAISLISGTAYFLHAAFPDDLRFLLPIVLAAPLACNRAIRAGFETSRRPVWQDLGILVFLLGFGLAARVGAPGWTGLASSLLSLALFVELPIIVWRGLPDDLVAARRSIRIWALGLSAVLGAGVAIASVLGGAVWAVPIAAGLTCGLIFAAVAFGGGLPDTLSASPQAAKSPLDSREQQILRRLREVIAEAYSDPNLTLSKLAQRLDVPEHRLRRVIHLGEGQGNFSAWLSGYRIAAFKARIDEDATILTLALAVGYNSLSAFNRAFKAAEGVTPSAFRAARKANAKAISEPTPETPNAT